MKNLANITDVELSLLIANTVKKAVAENVTEFVTAEQLLKKFQMFNPSWLRRNGHLLPRVRAIVINKETGKEHKTGYAYNLQAIRSMIDNDELRIYSDAKCKFTSSKKATNKNLK